MDSEFPPTAVTPPDSEGNSLLPVTLNVDPGISAYKEVSSAKFPVVDDSIENCRLLVKLGSGASGRAFLAQQEALADRPLVLKFTPADSRDEHMKLARLQHTHIMPLYWVSTLPELGLRVLAMPYLGSTNLAGLLQRLKDMPVASWNGTAAFKVLHDTQAQLPMQIAVQDQAAEALKNLTWVEFVLRLGETLAEALAYAHQRDLLHLDLKPANILVTPDGQPILLDLDMARKPIPAGVTLVSWLGGTPAFTSPEQFEAITARSLQLPIPKAVDRRSDLYSLGLVLFDALGGQRELRARPNLDELRRRNRAVSQGLTGILARCLAEEPDDRYSDGFALAEDLRRERQHLPLVGVRNSWRDRWRKWRRRRPMALTLGLALTMIVIGVGAVGTHHYQLNEDRRRQAELALVEGHELQRKGQHEAALQRFQAGKDLADETYGAGAVGRQLARRLRMAQRLQKAEELDRVVHLMRFYALQEHTPRRMRYVLHGAGDKLWADRHLLIDQSAGKLELAAEKNIVAQLQELVTLWSDWRLRLAPASLAAATRAEVGRVLAEAEQLFGPSLALSLAREQHGFGPRADLVPQDTWEYCALGRMALTRGRYEDAAGYLRKAIDREPFAFVPHFYYGVCMLRKKDYQQAVEAFSYCAGRDASAEVFLLRGQAQAALGADERALRDFDLAIEKNRVLGIAYQQRGQLLQKLGRTADANKDLEIAGKLTE